MGTTASQLFCIASTRKQSLWQGDYIVNHSLSTFGISESLLALWRCTNFLGNDRTTGYWQKLFLPNYNERGSIRKALLLRCDTVKLFGSPILSSSILVASSGQSRIPGQTLDQETLLVNHRRWSWACRTRRKKVMNIFKCISIFETLRPFRYFASYRYT